MLISVTGISCRRRWNHELSVKLDGLIEWENSGTMIEDCRVLCNHYRYDVIDYSESETMYVGWNNSVNYQ